MRSDDTTESDTMRQQKGTYPKAMAMLEVRAKAERRGNASLAARSVRQQTEHTFMQNSPSQSVWGFLNKILTANCAFEEVPLHPPFAQRSEIAYSRQHREILPRLSLMTYTESLLHVYIHEKSFTLYMAESLNYTYKLDNLSTSVFH